MKQKNPQSAVETFRKLTGKKRIERQRAPLPTREKLIISLVILMSFQVAYCFGGMRLWAQWVAAAMGIIIFISLFIPFNKNKNEFTVRSSKPGENFARLIRFPPFWFGLFLILYIVVQGFNTAADYVKLRSIFGLLEETDFIEWLPSGLATPFEEMNPSRVLLIIMPAWLVGCTICVGIQRRRSLLILFNMLVFNTTLMALIALLQKLTHTKNILWFIETSDLKFWGTFFYPNQGTVYLLLGLSLSISLYFYYVKKSARTFAKSGPHYMFFIFSLIAIFSIILSLVRGCMLFAGVLIILFLLIKFRQILSSRFERSSIAISFIIVLTISALSFGFYSTLDKKYKFIFKREWKELYGLTENPETSIRYQQNIVTWEMIKDNWLFGNGAGSFRYRFPVYQRASKALSVRLRVSRKYKPLYFSHAHNDWFQLTTELGIIGMSSIFLMLLYWFKKIWEFRRFINDYHFFLIIGCLCIFCYGAIDYLVYNPAILLLFTLCLTGLMKWLAIEKEYST